MEGILMGQESGGIVTTRLLVHDLVPGHMLPQVWI